MAVILVVDDDKDFAKTLASALFQRGHHVSLAQDPTAALAEVNKLAPDLILMDMQMPGGGAPFAVNLIERNPGFAKIPMIFVSAMKVPEMMKWFPQTPSRRYLNKPFEFSALFKCVEELQPKASEQPAPAATLLPTFAPGSSLTERLREAGKAPAADANQLASRLVDVLIQDALAVGASDIHLCPERTVIRILFRVDGALREAATYSKAELSIVPRLRVMAGLSPSPPSIMVPEEGGFDVPGASLRVRLATIPSTYGEKVTVRLLNMNGARLSVDLLGFLPDDAERMKSAMSRQSGIFLVCGPTGSGKTTTLCSLLQAPELRSSNVATLEDPVEYQVPGVTHTQVVPKAGFTFAEGLRALLRHDVDAIMLGEIRDGETATLAMQAATSGHLILSTIHSTSAIGVIPRLLGLDVEPYLIGNALTGALMQRLVRRVCRSCIQPEAPSSALLQRCLRDLSREQAARVNEFVSTPNAQFGRGRGCGDCGGSGYKGRIGLFELFLVDPEVRKLVFSGADMSAVTAAAIKAGAKPLLEDALAKAALRWITLEDALRAVL